MSLKDWSGWIFLGIALLLGGGAFWMSQAWLSEREQRIRAEFAGRDDGLVQVVVASRDLVPGDVIGPRTMALGRLPAAHVSARVVRPGDFEAAQGRVVTTAMSSGEPLTVDLVAGLYVERFSDLLDDGERAVSLEVSAMDNHSGMLVPGDFIDLYVLLQQPQDRVSSRRLGRQQVLHPVLDRVKVLAAGPAPLRAADQRFQPLDERGRNYRQITVGVERSDAERLLLARAEGEMTYLLRRAGDQTSAFGSDARSVDEDEPTYHYLLGPG
jgi:pilus assembly protein CpaB